MPLIELTGCAPEPLMSYLKALGILRLVSEQFNRSVRGAWRDGVFFLDLPTSDADELLQYFTERYAPTPITAPWAGGCGFFGKDNRTAVDAIASSSTDRMSSYRQVIERVRSILTEEGIGEKPEGDTKDRLLRRYRREMPDKFIEWMDAALVIQAEGQVFPPLLGTGGNDGRLDFTQNFMQRVVGLGLQASSVRAEANDLLRHSLFGDATLGLSTAAVGQFAPGRSGGPNAAQGFSGAPLDNPWDFILMIEGTLLLSGSVARRMGVNQRDKAIFPFTVRANPVGFDSPSESEASEARGEIWLPVWRGFASLAEVRTIFAEGRAELSGRQSRDGVDFARAIAGLGVDRGIKSFVRFGFLKRSGKAFLAPALGRFDVPQGRDSVGLLTDVDPWLDRFRSACREEGAPARFTSALRRIDAAIFDYCRYGTKPLFASILRALGNAERELASGEKFRSNERRTIRPLGGLRPDWIEAAKDESVEFELALSLAGVVDPEGRIGPLHVNLEPVDPNRKSWAERDPGVVWQGGDVSANLTAVLRRRLINAARVSGGKLPVQNRATPAGLAAVSAFLTRDMSDGKLEELLWGLLAVSQESLTRQVPNDAPALLLPRTYALLKQLFVPHPLDQAGQPVMVQTEPEILSLLGRGDVERACTLAMRRLRAAGFEPLPHRQSGRGNRDREWRDAAGGVDAGRLAAALLFPISERDAQCLLSLITRKLEDERQCSRETKPEGVMSE